MWLPITGLILCLGFCLPAYAQEKEPKTAAEPVKTTGKVIFEVSEQGTEGPLPCRIHILDKRLDNPPRAVKTLLDIFERTDKDGTGRATIKDMTTPDAPDWLPYWLSLADADGDGVITRAELPGFLVDLEEQLLDMPVWHNHFSCPGRASLEMPPGEYPYLVARGPEYKEVEGTLTITAGAVTRVSIQLERLADLATEGWWSGELHIHRPVRQMEAIMAAEDLHVAPTLTWWNQQTAWDREPVPAETVLRFGDARYCDILGGEDERGGGAFLFFRMQRPLPILQAEREYPCPLVYIEKAKNEQPQSWIDIEKPFWWDVPLVLAHGYGDSIGLANNHMHRTQMMNSEAWGRPRDPQYDSPVGNALYSQDIYYKLIDSGIRIGPSAGSASGVMPHQVGYNRVYVHLDGPFDYAKWWDGLKAGRSFVTNGPLLCVEANGQRPGHVFQTKNGEHVDIDLTVKLSGNDRVPAIEIVRNGVVERSVPAEVWGESGALGRVSFDRSGWFLVRAIADNSETFRFASTAPFYVEIGETKRRISKSAAQYFLQWVQDRMASIQIEDEAKREEVLAYHRKAEEFWKDRVAQANAD